MASKKEIKNAAPEARWLIDMDWYAQNNRSFSTMAKKYLCAECTQKLAGTGGEINAAQIVSAVRDCCGQRPDFISRSTPIMDSMFGILLSRGNEPLDLTEFSRILGESRGDIYGSSPELLGRLLSNDNYYGFSKVEV